MKRVIVTHGTFGSPTGNWFPWLGARLAETGIKFIIPAYPTPAGQNLQAWTAVFDDQVGDLVPDDILIGHSLGMAFNFRMLQRMHVDKVKASISVAGFHRPLGLEDFDPLNESFVAGGFDWPLLRGKAAQHLCVAGDDDPYVPLIICREIAQALNVEPIVVKDGGHLNTEYGYEKFPLLLDLILRIS